MAFNQTEFDSFVASINDGSFTGTEINLSGLGLNDTDVQNLMCAIYKIVVADIPPLAARLENLDLSYNKLRLAPDVSRCPKLKKLNLEYNRIFIPPYILDCHDLEELVLSANLMISLPDITGLNKLRVFMPNKPSSPVGTIAMFKLNRDRVAVELQPFTFPDMVEPFSDERRYKEHFNHVSGLTRRGYRLAYYAMTEQLYTAYHCLLIKDLVPADVARKIIVEYLLPVKTPMDHLNFHLDMLREVLGGNTPGFNEYLKTNDFNTVLDKLVNDHKTDKERIIQCIAVRKKVNLLSSTIKPLVFRNTATNQAAAVLEIEQETVPPAGINPAARRKLGNSCCTIV